MSYPITLAGVQHHVHSLLQTPSPSSGDPPTLASQVAAATGVHHTRLILTFSVEMGVLVAQAGLEFLG